ncbi:MAG: hypothetical protein HY069_01925 [Chlamydiia bacterium]|nr:hypothetical protein [Chlamydiia bacterium]
MSFIDSIHYLNTLLTNLSRDMLKVQRGNKAAAQRVRVGTIRLEKVARDFRRESLTAEKRGTFKKKKKK